MSQCVAAASPLPTGTEPPASARSVRSAAGPSHSSANDTRKVARVFSSRVHAESGTFPRTFTQTQKKGRIPHLLRLLRVRVLLGRCWAPSPLSSALVSVPPPLGRRWTPGGAGHRDTLLLKQTLLFVSRSVVSNQLHRIQLWDFLFMYLFISFDFRCRLTWKHFKITKCPN